MRSRLVPTLVVLALVVAAVVAAVIAAPASGTPDIKNACTGCHSGTPSGTVTATPSTATPAAGTTYTVAIHIGLTASGNTGYHIAQTDAGGAATTWTTVFAGGPGSSQTSWTATMTAPPTAGVYYYKVWCVKGPDSSSGMAKSMIYSITVPPPAPAAVLTSLSPNRAETGASVVIAGSNLGTSGAVRFGTTVAATSAWSATSVTTTVPASLAPGATTVTVTPTGAASSNALAFTVDAPPVPAAVLTSLTPNHAQTGAAVVIAGTDFGSGGTVRFGSAVAATSAWSATSVTTTVPASLAPGATSVSVTPTGGAASNALAFTVDAPPPPRDTTAPTTTASGATPDAWCNYAVTVSLSASDNSGGAGVASITYSVDGGSPMTVLGSSTKVTIDAPYQAVGDAAVRGAQGPHTITYHATDAAGNAESAKALTVNMDTVKPRTRAPHAAHVRRRQVAALEYEVRDATPNGGSATVVITVRNRHGRVVKTLHLGAKPVNTPLTARFRCWLQPGTYRFSVRATDLAGNRQASIASRTLTVRAASSRRE